MPRRPHSRGNRKSIFNPKLNSASALWIARHRTVCRIHFADGADRIETLVARNY